MAIKVAPILINGEYRVDPDTMDLLIRLAHHREFCEACTRWVEKQQGNYCPIGSQIIFDLEARPDVQFVPEPK